MKVNELPKLGTDVSETNCCPRFDPAPWEDKQFEFKDKMFVRDTTTNFMHVPINMQSIIKRTWGKIEEAEASNNQFVILSHDRSAWHADHYFAVTKDVPDCENVTLSGTYLTKVYEGPYSDAGKWAKDFEAIVSNKGKELKKMYFYYTTCPKCAKQYGENYTVAFGQI